MNVYSQPPLAFRMLATLSRRLLPRRLQRRLHPFFQGRGWEDVVALSDYRLHILLDDIIGRELYLMRWREADLQAIIQSHLRPGMAAFDVGGNIGSVALPLAKAVGSQGQVHSFEPAPEIFALLQKNLALNPHLAPIIHAHPFGLSDQNASLLMNVAGTQNLGASHIVAQETDDVARKNAGLARTIPIEVRTGDSVWESLGHPPIHLLKLDIEGHELHALRGMSQLLDANPDLIILTEVRESFLRAAGSSAEALFAFLLARGFSAYTLDRATHAWKVNNTTHQASVVVFARQQP